MAIYLPQQNVAIQVDDDPYSLPVDREAYPTARVIHMTSADFGSTERIQSLCEEIERESDGAHTPSAGTGAGARERLARLIFGAGPEAFASSYLESTRRARIAQAGA